MDTMKVGILIQIWTDDFVSISTMLSIPVIATHTLQLWYFPKRVWVKVIPHFKITDAKFTLGPQGIPLAAWILMVAGVTLTIFGSMHGACSCDYYYYSGACAMFVIGIVLLALHVPLLVLLPIIFIYLDIKTPLTKFFGVGAINVGTVYSCA